MKWKLKSVKEIFIVSMLSSLIPSIALANTGSDKISDILKGLIGLLTSGPAKLIFVISIIGVGYATLALGKIPKQQAAAIIIGIGIVFSASYIASQLGVSI